MSLDIIKEINKLKQEKKRIKKEKRSKVLSPIEKIAYLGVP